MISFFLLFGSLSICYYYISNNQEKYLKILFWDCESNAINEFIKEAQPLVELVSFSEFEDIVFQLDEEEPEAILFDYDVDKKLVEKEIKYLKKNFEDVKIILLSNVLNTKQLAKHQASKVGADIYLRTPMSSKLISSIFSPFFDITMSTNKESKSKPILRTLEALNESDEEESDLMDHLEDDIQELSPEDKLFQENIIEEHTSKDSIDPEAKLISDKMDLIFKEAIVETQQEVNVNLALEEIEKSENKESNIEVEDFSLDLDDGLLPENDDLAFPDEGDLAFPDDIENLNLDEEPDMSGHDENELSLDGMDDLEISSDMPEMESTQEEEGLELELDSIDDLEISSEISETETIQDEGGLELELSTDDSLEVSSDLSDIETIQEDQGLDLDLSDDLGISDPIEAEAVSEELDLSSDMDGLDDFNDESFDLSDNEDNSVDADSINLEIQDELEVVDDEEIEFGAIDDDDDDDDDSLSSSELPLTPVDVEDNELSFNTGIDLDGNEASMSIDAKDKLAEIDAMMLDSNEPIEENINITQINDDLIAANSDDETVMTNSNDFNLNEKVDKSLLKDHQAIKGHHNDELMRLGETIKNLREDREQLLGRVKDLEEFQGNKDRNSVSVKAELDEKKIEISILRKRYVQQIEEMKVQLDISNEKKEILAEKNKQFENEYENLNRKVRVDITKVKSRENELEGKLEMLRSDADIQIRNRDQKILELKRKIDTLEFDNESIQSRGQKIVNNKYELEGKMEKVIQTLRSAIGELEDDSSMARTMKDVKKSLDV
jgi:hypothetical protein